MNDLLVTSCPNNLNDVIVDDDVVVDSLSYENGTYTFLMFVNSGVSISLFSQFLIAQMLHYESSWLKQCALRLLHDIGNRTLFNLELSEKQ